MEGQSGTQAESFRAMQKLEIRISIASVSCFDDVKVGQVFGAFKPGLGRFKDTQSRNRIYILLLFICLSLVL